MAVARRWGMRGGRAAAVLLFFFWGFVIGRALGEEEEGLGPARGGLGGGWGRPQGSRSPAKGTFVQQPAGPRAPGPRAAAWRCRRRMRPKAPGYVHQPPQTSGFFWGGVEETWGARVAVPRPHNASLRQSRPQTALPDQPAGSCCSSSSFSSSSSSLGSSGRVQHPCGDLWGHPAPAGAVGGVPKKLDLRETPGKGAAPGHLWVLVTTVALPRGPKGPRRVRARRGLRLGCSGVWGCRGAERTPVVLSLLPAACLSRLRL